MNCFARYFMNTMKKLLTYAVIILLALVCAVSYQLFVLPNRFAPAGLNGICTMIQYVSGINIGYLSLVVNIPLAIWVYFSVSRSMGFRSMIYVGAFSIALILLGRLDVARFSYETANGTSKILGPLVAGIISGACYSLLLQMSSSSGGTDFIAAIIHKKHPEQGFFWISFLLNLVVAITSYFVYDFEMEPVILCILYSFMSSTVSDRLLKSRRSAVQCEIITNYPDQISKDIIAQLHHSATLLPGTGMYSNKETGVLLCIINKSQLPMLAEIVSKYPHSFAVLSDVSQVVGNFKHIDAHGRQKKKLLDHGDSKMG